MHEEDFFERLSEIINKSESKQISTAKRTADGTFFLLVQLDDQILGLSTDNVRLVFGSLDGEGAELPLPLQQESPVPRALKLSTDTARRSRTTPRRGSNLTVQELREQGLPLYWNEEWLRRELERLGSWTAIAREHGYRSPHAISSYAQRNYGLSLKRRYEEIREHLIADYATGKYSQKDLADKYEVAPYTAHRWIKADERSSADSEPEQSDAD